MSRKSKRDSAREACAPRHFRDDADRYQAWLAGARYLAEMASDIEGWSEYRVGDRALGKLNLIKKDEVRRREPRLMLSELTFLKKNIDQLLADVETEVKRPKQHARRKAAAAAAAKRDGDERRKYREQAIATLKEAVQAEKPHARRAYLERLILRIWHHTGSSPQKQKDDNTLGMARAPWVKLSAVIRNIADRCISMMGPRKGAYLVAGYIDKMSDQTPSVFPADGMNSEDDD